ncbi:MFS transporter [Luteipulveratus mongoliensis]|uniref:Major facilitator superfamily (MFS) profile domain-containing protein n=1 Tax=Luteipulveratus mongoliensis TaxID=571913 RepID=A0A0K1JPJ9_9MICO|nr:MFS transporter [Luteipulveratus mongoliensis]AKU18636.1 hypothetical protein VV02_04415 [Luteipulveratus mongoliensis]
MTLDIAPTRELTLERPANTATRRTVHALLAAGVAGGLAQSLSGTAGSLLAREIGDSDRVAGLPQTFLVAGAAVSALVLGRLVARVGRLTALMLAAATAGAGAALAILAALMSDLTLLFAGSALMGAGNTAVMLGRYAAADLGPAAHRARAMGLAMAATTVGAVAGPNLLEPTASASAWLGAPALAGPMVLAMMFFLIGATILSRAPRQPRSVTTVSLTNAAEPLQLTAIAGLAILAVTNLVMVGVMTMAPVHMHHHGASLTAMGLAVSMHIAGMFAPSPVTGWLTDRFGPAVVAAGGGIVLVTAGLVAAYGNGSTVVLTLALLLLGVGWNIGLVSGSVLLTEGVPEQHRAGRESWGEVAMGVAAVIGSAGAGLIVAASDYTALAVIGAAFAAVVLPAAWLAGQRGALEDATSAG